MMMLVSTSCSNRRPLQRSKNGGCCDEIFVPIVKTLEEEDGGRGGGGGRGKGRGETGLVRV